MSYPPPGPDPYGRQPGYGPPGPMQPVQPMPTSGRATTSLVLGVVSLFFCGLLTGIPAIIVGISARREIGRSDGRLGGEGLALGGIITGILGTLWSLIVGGILVALLVFGAEVAQDYEDACDNIRNGQGSDDTFFGETVGPEDCL